MSNLTNTLSFFTDIINKNSDLTDREKDILTRRLCNEKFNEIGLLYGSSRQYIKQIEEKALSKLDRPEHLGFPRRGKKVKELRFELNKSFVVSLDQMDEYPIENLPFNMRAKNALMMHGWRLVGEIRENIGELFYVDGIGSRTISHIKDVLKEYYGTETI